MLAYDDVRDDYEIIEGVKFMAPSADVGHGNIVTNLIKTIGLYASINRLGICFGDHIDIHLPDGSLFQPDFTFISAANDRFVIDNKHGTIHGVPDMVAEIFSRSTMKRDLGIKKDVYERNGVKEYWLINPWNETIEIYLLKDGKYQFEDIYINYTDDDLKNMTDEERTDVQMEVPVNILDGFKVKIRNIFGWYFE